jgi:hypothetical protein
MDFALTRRKIGAAFTVGLAAMTAVFTTAPAESAKKASCTPLDLAFVVDTTGSMGGAIDNVKKGLDKIISEAKSVSKGDYRFGVVSVPGESITVNTPFADKNDAAAKSAIDSFSASGGAGEPEDTDGGVQTVIEGRKASDVSGTSSDPEGSRGPQTGDFQPPYRSGAQKLVVLITDAHPSGGDDSFEASDTAHVRALGNEAKSKGVRITAVYVPTSGVDPEIKALMKSYASRSGGQYSQTKPDGKGASAAIRASIASCGGKIKKRLKLSATPRVIRAGATRCVTFKVKSGKKAVRRATVSFAGRKAKTNRKGRATICAVFRKVGRRRATAKKSGFTAGHTSVFVRTAPRPTG